MKTSEIIILMIYVIRKTTVRESTQKMFCISILFKSAGIEAFFMIILMMLMMIWITVTMEGPMMKGKKMARNIEIVLKV